MSSESVKFNIKSLVNEIATIDSENISLLKEKTQALYNQLIILEYLESTEVEGVQNSISPVFEKEENYIDEADLKRTITEPIIEDLVIENTVETETPVFESISEVAQEIIQEPVAVEEESTEKSIENGPELLHELESITEGFELPEFEPAAPTINSVQEHPKSLNELLNKSVQIGLNDRIAFINHLFDRNQEDYTRVISQVNTLGSPQEVIDFINNFVKPEYKNWEGKEAIEERFYQVVVKRFEA